ncbi:hypothetical protein LCGC14_2485620, partial [marine sediment metagenome]
VALLAIAAGALTAELLVRPSPVSAQTAPAGRPGRAGRLLAIPAQIASDSYGLYLVDVNSGTICVYDYVGRERTLRLLAARTFVFDLKLDSYNTKPLPKDVAKMVSRAKRLKDVKPSP